MTQGQVNKGEPKKSNFVWWLLGTLFALVFVAINIIAPKQQQDASQATQQQQNQQVQALAYVPSKQVVAQVKKLVSKKPLSSTDAAQLQTYVLAARQRGLAQSDKLAASLIANADKRVAWADMRGKKGDEAVALCETAVQRSLKQPKSFDMIGHDEGYDPNEDWVMNVDLEADAMNGFGAVLRGQFSCRVACQPQTDQYGFNCAVTKVREKH
jgi:hypothetical protein